MTEASAGDRLYPLHHLNKDEMNFLSVTKQHGMSKARFKFSLNVIFLTAALLLQNRLYCQVSQDGRNQPVGAKDISIHQEINFDASPVQIYRILLSSKKFSECTRKSFPSFSQSSANIDSSLGGAFSLFDGHIVGRIVELIADRRLVEAWRVVDWPDGVYSIARFEFKPQDGGTKLIFDHIGFPAGLKEHLAMGWQEHYWGALRKYIQSP